jgi:N-acetylneuraminic acid mutarotase
MLRCGRLRALGAILIAASLGVLAGAATPATAATVASPVPTLRAAPSPIVPDATMRALLAKHAASGAGQAGQAGQAGKAATETTAAAGESPLCSAPASPLVARCYAIRVNGVTGGKGLRAAVSPPAGLSPSNLDSAYDLPPDGGSGATIGIVDAYDDPNAAADLAVYREQYGLPPLGSGQFIKVNQDGVQGDYPTADTGWAGEISLDLDMVSAIAPKANIILVEANSADIADLGASVNEAITLGAGYVSNSYGSDYASLPGGGETAQDLQLSADYYDHPGVAVVAAAGDDSYGVSFPAASPYVTAVGGTSLTQDPSTARGWTETAWESDGHGTGSGCSTIEPKPSFQLDSGCAMRTVADVSAVADPETGVAMYDSYGADGAGWEQAGGTSVATPIIASTYALAGPVATGTYPNSYPYAYPHVNDVTSGSDGTCDPAYLCTAGPGYDGPTGLGTPDGTSAFTYHPTGTLSGRITNAATQAGVSGVSVTMTDSTDQLSYQATTDSTGAYHIPDAAPGTYEVSASIFGYGTGTDDDVAVAAGQGTTADLALTLAPTRTVSGTVADGSGAGWPLYAKITIGGDPGGPVYTNPRTGSYSVDLPDDASYTMQVTPLYPGYSTPSPVTVALGASDVRQDVSVAADTALCDAPGYAYPAQANFDDWTTGPRYGWTVTDNGDAYGWEFDQDGWTNLTGGTGNFAIADPNNRDVAEDTDLTSPSFDLADVKSADLRFDALLIDGGGTGELDAAVSTDGGATWTTVYQQDGPVFEGQVDVPLTQALGHRDVELRLHYQGQGASLAQLDDVSVGQCQTLGGGFIEGNVTDANTRQEVNGATVTDRSAPAADPYAVAVSADTPGAAQPDGFYWLYSPKAGGNDAATTMPRYSRTYGTVTVSRSLQRYDPVLQAGRLQITPGKVSLDAPLNGKASQNVTLTNTGRAPVSVTVAEQTQAAPAPAASATQASASWENLPAYPVPVLDNVVGTYEGKTYSVGGISTRVGGTIYDNAYVYVPGASSWSPIAPLPQALTSAAGAFLDGTLYVVGGDNGSASDPAASTVYAYHPDSNTWSQVADLPAGRYSAAVATFDGKLYVIGGVDSAGNYSDLAYRYDPAGNTWSQIADYPVSAEYFGCGGLTDSIVCAGGAVASLPTASTYVYRPNSNTWTQAADMPYNVFGASYSSANGELQVVGGFSWAQYPWGGVSAVSKAVQYDPVTNGWTDLPSAPQAVLRAGNGTGCGLTIVGGTTGAPTGSTSVTALPGFDQCTGDDVSWLSESKTTVELAPGHSARIRVTADARGLAATGTYAATLSMITDSPYIYQPVQVSLTADRAARR